MTEKRIRKECFEQFEAEFAKLQRKAKQLNLPVPTYETVGEEITKIPIENQILFGDMPRNINNIQVLVVVNISDEEITIQGWKIACAIENIANGKSLYHSLETIPEALYHTDTQVCEHCGKKAFRKYIYILRNIESGEYKQVGSTCLEDFIEVKSGNKLADYLNKLIYLDKSSFGEDDDCATGKKWYSVDDVVLYAYSAIYKHGWVSYNSAVDGNGVSTVNRMREMMACCKNIIEVKNFDADSYLRGFFNHYYSFTPACEFDRNLKSVVLAGYVADESGCFGMIAYAVQKYNESLLVGYGLKFLPEEVGEKTTFTGTLIKKTQYCGQYGTSYSITLKGNNTLVSFYCGVTTKSGKLLSNLDTGTKVTVKGTIKQKQLPLTGEDKITFLNYVTVSV